MFARPFIGSGAHAEELLLYEWAPDRTPGGHHLLTAKQQLSE
jgi:hypothetical protein